MTDCSSTPTTFVEWDTVTVSKQTYTALPVTWSFNLQAGSITVPYTYPDLIVTVFTPGEVIVDVSTLLVDTVIICRITDTFQQPSKP
jgi:hypothetical protein